MIFTKLTLKNFKSHKNTVIEFEPGISIIVGENGAGKSTILDAISFALFKQHSSKKIDDLVRITKNKNSHEPMSVVLEFISNGKEYRVTRNRGSVSKAELLVKDHDGGTTRISSGDTAVTSEIRNIVDMDGDLFLNAIYIQQGEIASLIGKTPSEKKQLIGKLLGVEGLEKAWKNSLPLINIYENQKAVLEGRTASTSELDSDLKSKKVILEELKIKGTNLEKEILELEELKSIKGKEKFDMEDSKNRFDKLNTQLKNENENIKRVIDDNKKFQEQLEDLKSKEGEMNKLERFSLKLPIYLDFLESVKNLEQITKDHEKYQEKLNNIRKQKEILKNEEKGHDEYIQVQNKLNDFNERKSKFEGELAILKEFENNKVSIEKDIKDNEDKLKEFFDEANESLNLELDDFYELKRKVDNFKSEIDNKIKEFDEKYSSKSQVILILKEGIKSAEDPLAKIKKVDNQCPVCQSDITVSKKYDLIDSFKSKIKYNSESIDKLYKDLEKIKNEKNIFEQKLKDINLIEEGISENIPLQELINKDLEKIKEIDNKLKTYDDARDKIGDILLSIKDYKMLQESSKESHDKYVHAQGSLDVLGKEYDVKDKLVEVIRNLDMEVENVKVAISKDTHLSTDIKIEDLKERIEDLKEKDRKYNQLKGLIVQIPILESQIKNKKNEFDFIRSKIDTLENNIKAIRYDEDRYKNLVFTCERFEEKLKELNKELNEVAGKATEVIASIEELSLKINQNDIFKEKLNNIRDYLKLLKEIRELFAKDGIQKELRNRSKPIIQKYTKNFFEQFNFDYSDLKIDEEYNISVFGPEGETKLDMVSGGEKIAIALALRLGITKAMSKGNVETILLDEPTIHLDNYRRHELIDLLRGMSILPQMILVTHDSELENAADNIIKVQKEDGISNVVLAD